MHSMHFEPQTRYTSIIITLWTYLIWACTSARVEVKTCLAISLLELEHKKLLNSISQFFGQAKQAV